MLARPLGSKQPALKPQDLLVALKIAINKEKVFTFAELANSLYMSPSEVHAATKRAEMSRLLARDDDHRLVGIRSSLQEFVLYGVKYAFPPVIGPMVRGTPTGVGAAPLREQFGSSDEPVPVWPDFEGVQRGASLQPLYPTVPAAIRLDPVLYEVLALVDALRMGASRERELAKAELFQRLS